MTNTKSKFFNISIPSTTLMIDSFVWKHHSSLYSVWIIEYFISNISRRQGKWQIRRYVFPTKTNFNNINVNKFCFVFLVGSPTRKPYCYRYLIRQNNSKINLYTISAALLNYTYTLYNLHGKLNVNRLCQWWHEYNYNMR